MCGSLFNVNWYLDIVTDNRCICCIATSIMKYMYTTI